jgi:hypothetical protein
MTASLGTSLCAISISFPESTWGFYRILLESGSLHILFQPFLLSFN